MSKLNATDIQGFVLRGYNMPFARFCFLHFEDAESARKLVGALLSSITTGQLWDQGKPQSTLNIAFTFKGLVKLDLPLATLISFPVEFQEGMKSRSGILGDSGVNAPEHWDAVWRDETGASEVHAWLAVHALSAEALDARATDLFTLVEKIGGVRVLDTQDAASIVLDGNVTTKEHFGYTDGFGNPDYLGIVRKSQPGQGKLMPDGTWVPLATGELLLGYADEAGELPIAPMPHLLGANGTFMVYRKLHQNVGTFRRFLDEWSARYGAGDAAAKEKLASKFIGRWRDGTPIEISPNTPDSAITQDPNRSTNFTYGSDTGGARCPVGAHIRRVHPRDAFGFQGRLINRRRITRRGLPYGPYAASDDNSPDMDSVERGVVFMALNASISRQFEFVQQQWINYGNDAHVGNEKDPLIGNHMPGERFVIQGDTNPSNPPFVCAHLPNFVELRGGDYFFLPSMTALGMIAMNLVDPR
ncbi:Dyp-type peroxidase [Acidicapsa dinghuensis]|uniref:Dyp-type peroxidase n=1 Tax=Acidicapsa dinghuensis TaxID=2218256 RepID=A0ABW1EKH6_9BACT|nr:dyp-type peroxidase [Acidicapsa dinghuensis]